MNEGIQAVTVNNATGKQAQEWNGCTLEQLRQRRAISLVKREVGKERLNHVLDTMRTRVANNGVRGLFFNNNDISGLRAADYMLLGLRLAQSVMKWRRKRK